MLKKINTADLKNGVRYSANVFFDDGQNMLLQKGSPITDYELNILKKWEIDYVITEGEPVPDGVELFKNEITEELEELGELEELEDAEEIDNNLDTAGLPFTETTNIKTEQINNDISNISTQNISKLNTDTEYLELHSEYTDIIKMWNNYLKSLKIMNT